MRERERREEERVRRETEDGLRAFRERQKGGGGDAVPEAAQRPEEEEQWGVGRKRKRGGRERDVKGVRRKVSDAGEAKHAGDGDGKAGEKRTRAAEDVKKPQRAAATPKEAPKEKRASVLVDYGSDSDDD